MGYTEENWKFRIRKAFSRRYTDEFRNDARERQSFLSVPRLGLWAVGEFSEWYTKPNAEKKKKDQTQRS